MPNRTQDLAWSDAASAPEALEGRQRALPSGTAKEREKIYIYISCNSFALASRNTMLNKT